MLKEVVQKNLLGLQLLIEILNTPTKPKSWHPHFGGFFSGFSAARNFFQVSSQLAGEEELLSLSQLGFCIDCYSISLRRVAR